MIEPGFAVIGPGFAVIGPGLTSATAASPTRHLLQDKALKSHERPLARFVLRPTPMTQPRMVLADSTCMLTRRTLRRHHLFRPDPAIKQLYLYTLAVCALQFDIDVHTVVLMSTHEHVLLTDTQGRLPLFTRRLHRLVALGTKVLRKWDGPVWDHGRPSVVRLLTERAIIEKLGYLLTNPVKAGLVGRAREWPGVTVLPQELGRRTWTIRRPDFFFDPDNPNWPETVELRLTLPPALTDIYQAHDIRQAVADEVAQQEQLARQEVRRRGWAVLGAERVRRLSPYQRATSFEPLRARNPTFAVGRGQRRAFFRAAAELGAFRRAYREALKQWRAGIRDTVFPEGTWCMRCLHGVRLEPAAGP